jgi:voltage-gated potassium channel
MEYVIGKREKADEGALDSMPHFEWPKHGFLGLLVGLVSLIVVYPFFYDLPFANLILDIFISFILIFSIYSFSQKRQIIIIALFFAVPAFIISWSKYFFTNPFLTQIELIFRILFFGYILIVLTLGVFKARKVTTNIIYGSICIYLLMGLTWAFIYSFLELTHPGSFNSALPEFAANADPREGLTLRLAYYSYVTLTTLGYGDITPVTPPAQLISSLEAITGQLYLAILVARLIGMHLFAASKSD